MRPVSIARRLRGLIRFQRATAGGAGWRDAPRTESNLAQMLELGFVDSRRRGLLPRVERSATSSAAMFNLDDVSHTPEGTQTRGCIP
jgi:hypothetical protein